MRLVQALDRHRRVTAVPFQKPGTLEAYGLTVAECEAAAWAITPDGARYRGAGAIDMALAVGLGVGLPYWLYRIPGVGWVQDRVYDWVVANRHRLPGDVPYCDQYPDACR